MSVTASDFTMEGTEKRRKKIFLEELTEPAIFSETISSKYQRLIS
jgi:hypothetical protein